MCCCLTEIFHARLHFRIGCLESVMAEKRVNQKVEYDQNKMKKCVIRNILGDPKWMPGVVVSHQSQEGKLS